MSSVAPRCENAGCKGVLTHKPRFSHHPGSHPCRPKSAPVHLTSPRHSSLRRPDLDTGAHSPYFAARNSVATPEAQVNLARFGTRQTATHSYPGLELVGRISMEPA